MIEARCIRECIWEGRRWRAGEVYRGANTPPAHFKALAADDPFEPERSQGAKPKRSQGAEPVRKRARSAPEEKPEEAMAAEVSQAEVSQEEVSQEEPEEAEFSETEG